MSRAAESRQETLRRLYSRRTFGIKFGLHVEEALLRRLGHPERTYGVIHVAGTNGKGSVCALIESVLRQTGLRTGLYTSPHLVRLNERVAVRGQPIADDELFGLIGELEAHAQCVGEELRQEPTFFEFCTALGFEHFRRAGVRVAVVETGMGGRLDATNVVVPLVSVITAVSLEHTQYLGGDVASIAREKAGIIKPGRPVVCGELAEAAMEVIASVAGEQEASVRVAARGASVRVMKEDLEGQTVEVEGRGAAYGRMRLPLLGRHQAANLVTAVAALETVGEVLGIEVPAEAVRAGVEAVAWPGRLQVLRRDPPVILDGAHNPGAAEALAAALKRLLKRRPVALVLGMCQDKDVVGFVKPFGGLVKRVWVVPIGSERNMAPGLIRSAAAAMGWEAAAADVAGALAGATAWAQAEGGAVCVTGSLFLVGEVLGGGCLRDPNEGGFTRSSQRGGGGGGGDRQTRD